MQIPVLNGIYANQAPDFRVAYPRNMMPVPRPQGISNGYLRPADGTVSEGTGPGVPRGAIRWGDVCYRVMGTKLVSVAADGTVTTLGDVGGITGQCSFDHSFDRLAIASNGNLYYWNGTTLTQVTDTDLGTVLDVLWVDGYFMTTDGTNLVVTELSDPTAVDPLKYGSSEADPDPIKAVLKLHREVHAINRYSIEVFENVGGAGFPFRVIDGAQIGRGAIGTHACCLFAGAIAFLGGGRDDEAPAIWLGANGASTKISTGDVDETLSAYPETELAAAIVEARVDKGHELLYIHLPDKTLVYDAAASVIVKEPVWFILTTGLGDGGRYRARDLVWCHDKWMVADPTTDAVGRLDNTVSSHWGNVNSWEFSTLAVYNKSLGAIVHELELVGLPGRAALGDDPTIYTSYSLDGQTWSQEFGISAGKQGERNKRLVWLQQGPMRNYRIQKFCGTSDAQLSVARLEARLEALAA